MARSRASKGLGGWIVAVALVALTGARGVAAWEPFADFVASGLTALGFACLVVGALFALRVRLGPMLMAFACAFANLFAVWPRDIRGIISSAPCIMFPICGRWIIRRNSPNGNTAMLSRSGRFISTA